MSATGTTVRRATLTALALALGLAFLAQLYIDPSLPNVACAIVVVTSTILMLLYLEFTDAMDRQPLSTLVLLGFCTTTQFGALLAQSLAGTALSASLRQPIETFSTLAAYQLLAIAVHAVYRLFANRTDRVSLVRHSLQLVGLYSTPKVPALWIMGALGCVSYFFSRSVIYTSDGSAGGGVLGAVASSFNFLISAPFLIPLYMKLQGPGYCRPRWVYPGLVVYALLAVTLALLRNARVIMFVGVATVGFGYLLVCLQSRAPLRPGMRRRIILAVIALAVIAAPLSDLATAMAIARPARTKASGTAMLAKTIEVWRKPYLIQQYRDRQSHAGLFSRYDESYIANPLFARLVETKFHDNALYFAKSLDTSASTEKLQKITADFLWSTLPTPLLQRLGVRIDKDDLNFSMGDYLAYLSRGVPLGGRKTGSIFAQGQAVFGALFPFVYALLCLVLFKWMDLLCTRRSDGSSFPVTAALLTSWQLVHLLAPESLHQVCLAIVRGIPQDIAVYALVFLLARVPTGSGSERRKEVALPSGQVPA